MCVCVCVRACVSVCVSALLCARVWLCEVSVVQVCTDRFLVQLLKRNASPHNDR